MKKTFTLFFLLHFVFSLYGQTPVYKFGSVPKSELEMTVYENDSSAPAVVLYENIDVYYTINRSDGNIERTTEYCVRIKILTK